MSETAAILRYVLENHSWCSQPHRCDHCGGNPGYCSEHPEKPRCEGCEAEARATELLARLTGDPDAA